MTLIAAAAETTRSYTTVAPEFFQGFVTVLGLWGLLLILLLIAATILLPLFVVGIYSRLKKLDRIVRKIGEDIVNELRRRP